MAKYYLTSGNVRTVISADDAEKAALWVVHKVMQQVLPVYSEGSSEACLEYSADGVIAVAPSIESAEVAVRTGSTTPKQLGTEILVSEEGFGGDDAGRLETFELVCHWNQLMVALDRLQAIV